MEFGFSEFDVTVKNLVLLDRIWFLRIKFGAHTDKLIDHNLVRQTKIREVNFGGDYTP